MFTAVRTSLSKKAKGSNPRSKFLSSLMKTVSGTSGDKLIQSYANGDKDQFLKLWAAVGQKMADKLAGS